MTSYECLMAADLQNQHPNVTSLSSSGRFGSKFVTVVISGARSRELLLSITLCEKNDFTRVLCYFID